MKKITRILIFVTLFCSLTISTAARSFGDSAETGNNSLDFPGCSGDSPISMEEYLTTGWDTALRFVLGSGDLAFASPPVQRVFTTSADGNPMICKAMPAFIAQLSGKLRDTAYQEI